MAIPMNTDKFYLHKHLIRPEGFFIETMPKKAPVAPEVKEEKAVKKAKKAE